MINQLILYNEIHSKHRNYTPLFFGFHADRVLGVPIIQQLNTYGNKRDRYT